MITKLTTPLLITLLIIGSSKLKAQVTIGSDLAPIDATLLELKSKDASNPASVTDDNNITSDKGGLLLPRVMLVNRKTLEPFVKTTDPAWTGASASKIKEKHTGLTVYNINESAETVTELNKIFHQGVYLWDGAKWVPVGDSNAGQRYFHMPAFNLPLTQITQVGDTKPTYDLYAEYKKQFTNNSNNPLFESSNNSIAGIPSPEYGKLYEASELDFAVTHYDKDVLTINSIDADGVMTYEVKSLDPGPNSFVNIVFVIK
ncbi:hypothetical protein D0T84_19725 [Dysgonomonas sp. 521]|uniref:hypothetical protein n=1 Tax=Dysgonomonas sp. 521 TaxID=2302932 RepID=UPI0013D2C6E7|nr:hypothetical protein [Dysgonomonas sp. 521]NDV97113.1 hypothetical protein [Dysgonomonas sp. 521]